jgi:hypothetical protein
MDAAHRFRVLTLAIVSCAAALLLAAGFALAAAGPGHSRARCPRCWHPGVHATFQIQFAGTLKPKVRATAFEVDAFDTTKAQVRLLKHDHHVPVCYVDGGTWESWRPDHAQFPASVIGAADAGWQGENWLDIRQTDILLPIMRARMRMCVHKGFRAVDVDNADAYTNTTGFPLTATDQLRYNRAMADAAHALHLSIALKNDGAQVPELLRWYDFAVVESCVDYDECAPYHRFVRARKPVFLLEYDLPLGRFCPEARKLGFFAQRKRLSLSAWRQPCPKQ